jgi:signal transduction histidine kinase
MQAEMSGARAAPEDDPLVVEDAEAQRSKRQRALDHHTRQIPRLRLLGMLLLAVVTLVQCGLIAGAIPWRRLAWVSSGSLAYSLASWWVLRRWFARVTAVNLGTVFLAIDLLWFAAMIWVSGADRSWLVLVLLVRVADQTNTTLRRVLIFLHLSVASYGLVLLAQALLDHRPPVLQVEAAKLAIVYVTGLYVAATARTAERLRDRTSRAIHVAREVIQRLRSQSEALEKARADAERADRAKTAFLGNMGHELRTPLTAVIGLTELVLETELSPEQREQLVAVQSCGAELVRMINDVLDLARLESGALRLRDGAVDLRAILARVADELRAAAAPKGLAVTVTVTADLPPLLRGDPERLTVILAHLGRNAVKFTNQGEVGFTARLLGFAGGRAEVEIAVTDTGIGIDGPMQARIFDAFTQVEASTRRRHGGAGLGLALVSRLVALMDGRVGLESEPGRGSRFHVHLRLAPPAGAGDLACAPALVPVHPGPNVSAPPQEEAGKERSP